ncbi:MAG: hypothetical protein HY706_04390 [Candidatus Hydrogenedentes bacterium]|nr:hypothetical protein [Candidatus Hydrogenedentota bacterium]
MMSVRLSAVDVAVVLIYLAVVVILGTVMKRRAARNIGSYFLGERQLPWWALAMSGSSSYFDITGTMWIVSLFVVIGLKGFWVQWIWGFIIPVFYKAYMGKWIRRSGVMTGAEWMETRFGSGKPGELARDAGLPVPSSAAWDLATVAAGIPWLMAMYFLPVYLVLHRFSEAAMAGVVITILSAVLYFVWFRKLENE